MRILFTIFALLVSSTLFAADTKISDFPLGSAASSQPNDSFPFYNSTTGKTYRLTLYDLINIPTIAAISGGSGVSTTNTVSSTFTVPTLVKPYILNVNSSGGVVPITLGDAVASDGFCIDIKNLGANAVNVGTSMSQTIDTLSSSSIADQMDSNRYCAVGGNWFIY